MSLREQPWTEMLTLIPADGGGVVATAWATRVSSAAAWPRAKVAAPMGSRFRLGFRMLSNVALVVLT